MKKMEHQPHSRPLPKEAGFQIDLQNLTDLKPFQTDYTPDDEPVEWALRRFDAFEANANTLYLSENFLRLAGASLDSVAFRPRTASAARKSRHGVFFGDLQVGLKCMGVAVKPFEDDISWQPAVREQIITNAFAQKGLRTLKPLGVVLVEDDEENRRAYGLTRLENSMTTFQAMNWDGFYPGTRDKREHRRMWRDIAIEAAKMHNSGRMSHGDFWPRNFATTPTVMGMIIDHETGIISPEAPRDAETRFSYSSVDILAALRGVLLPQRVPNSDMHGLGMVRGQNYNYAQAFREIFFNYYLDARIDLSAHVAGRERSDVNEEIDQLDKTIGDYANRIQNEFAI